MIKKTYALKTFVLTPAPKSLWTEHFKTYTKSARVVDVIMLVCLGLSAKEIGRALKIDSRTVATYKRRGKELLSIGCDLELGIYANQNGLVSLEEI